MANTSRRLVNKVKRVYTEMAIAAWRHVIDVARPISCEKLWIICKNNESKEIDYL